MKAKTIKLIEKFRKIFVGQDRGTNFQNVVQSISQKATKSVNLTTSILRPFHKKKDTMNKISPFL